ncbi:MAG: ECF-type sigma factor [Pirellulales bacterium]
MNDVTQILSRIESGDSTASEQLLPLVYDAACYNALLQLCPIDPILVQVVDVLEGYSSSVEATLHQFWLNSCAV